MIFIKKNINAEQKKIQKYHLKNGKKEVNFL